MPKSYIVRRIKGIKSEVFLEYGEIYVRSWCESRGKQFSDSWSARDVFGLILFEEDPYTLAYIKHNPEEFYFQTLDSTPDS
jgi:hypothetical protein